jgi:hypothetical protein
LATLIAVLLLAYLPGAVLFRVPGAERAWRARRPAEERGFWAVLLSVIWSVAVAMALGAAGAYRLDRVLLINGGAALALAIAARGRLTFAGEARWPGPGVLLPAAIAGLGIWLYFPAAEYFMGGKDPGVYVSEGVQIARGGGLTIDDRSVASVPAESRDLFFSISNARFPYYVRFMGFLMPDPPDGHVTGQFPHGFPASVALAYDVAGLDGARAAIAIWAVLGLLAVYFAGARLLGRVGAAIACVLLAINVLEVWFGRYPNAELMSQAMLFAALLAFRHTLDGSPRFFGIVAALLVGLQLFIRFDALVSVGAIGGAALLAAVTRERVGWPFAVTFLVTSTIGIWYLVSPMYHYSAGYTGTVYYSGGYWIAAALAIAAAAFVRLMRVERMRQLTEHWLPRVLAATIVGLAVYAYFFREPGGRLAPQDAYALRRFAWYVTDIGLWAAIAGFGLLILTRFWKDPAFFVTAAAYSVLIFYKPRIVPEHFWTGRRFLTMILPAVMLSMVALPNGATGLQTGRIRSLLRPLAVVARLALVLGLAFVYWRQAAPVRAHVEYAGLQHEIERLTASVGPKDLLLVESRRADSDLHVLGLPLAYLYGRPVLVLDSPAPDKRKLESFFAWARQHYANVYFLGGGGTDLLTRSLDADMVASRRFGVPEYASTLHAYPDGVRRKEFDYGIYRLRSIDRRAPGPVDLRIGAEDDLNVARFYAKERRPDGTTFRWTKNRAFVMLTGIAPGAKELVISMGSGGRPAAAPPATVTITALDRELGTVTLTDEIRPHRFALPADVVARAVSGGDPLRVTIDVPTWNPNTLLKAPDRRDLGVLVTRVQVQ